MFGTSLVLLMGGWSWNGSMRVNKNLWTPAFVRVSSGLSLLALSLLHAAADMARLHKRAHVLRMTDWPWIVFGANAIVAFAISVLLSKIISAVAGRTGFDLGSGIRESLYAKRKQASYVSGLCC